MQMTEIIGINLRATHTFGILDRIHITTRKHYTIIKNKSVYLYSYTG